MTTLSTMSRRAPASRPLKARCPRYFPRLVKSAHSYSSTQACGSRPTHHGPNNYSRNLHGSGPPSPQSLTNYRKRRLCKPGHHVTRLLENNGRPRPGPTHPRPRKGTAPPLPSYATDPQRPNHRRPMKPALHDDLPPTVHYLTTPPYHGTDDPSTPDRSSWCPHAAPT